MAKKNRTCFTCGEKYYYCPSCADEFRPTWMVMFDCEECKSIFQICSSYFTGSISKEDARDVLEKIGLKEFDSYEESVAKELKEICTDDVSKKEDEEKVE